MSSQVEICNMALSKTGSDAFITSIDQNTKPAILLKNVYHIARKSLLRSYLWKFARKRTVLAPNTDVMPFDAANRFTLPTDCLRVVGTDESTFKSYQRWFVEDGAVVFNDTAFNLVYISDVTDPEKFDAIFTEAFAAKLAVEICMPLAQDQSLKAELTREFAGLVTKASFVGATESDSDKFISETLIHARQ